MSNNKPATLLDALRRKSKDPTQRHVTPDGKIPLALHKKIVANQQRQLEMQRRDTHKRMQIIRGCANRMGVVMDKLYQRAQRSR